MSLVRLPLVRVASVSRAKIYRELATGERWPVVKLEDSTEDDPSGRPLVVEPEKLPTK